MEAWKSLRGDDSPVSPPNVVDASADAADTADVAAAAAGAALYLIIYSKFN